MCHAPDVAGWATRQGPSYDTREIAKSQRTKPNQFLDIGRSLPRMASSIYGAALIESTMRQRDTRMLPEANGGKAICCFVPDDTRAVKDPGSGHDRGVASEEESQCGTMA